MYSSFCRKLGTPDPSLLLYSRLVGDILISLFLCLILHSFFCRKFGSPDAWALASVVSSRSVGSVAAWTSRLGGNIFISLLNTSLILLLETRVALPLSLCFCWIVTVCWQQCCWTSRLGGDILISFFLCLKMYSSFCRKLWTPDPSLLLYSRLVGDIIISLFLCLIIHSLLCRKLGSPYSLVLASAGSSRSVGSVAA